MVGASDTHAGHWVMVGIGSGWADRAPTRGAAADTTSDVNCALATNPGVSKYSMVLHTGCTTLSVHRGAQKGSTPGMGYSGAWHAGGELASPTRGCPTPPVPVHGSVGSVGWWWRRCVGRPTERMRHALVHGRHPQCQMEQA
eukprot:365019-Chlamydomonas_euryale.AAC.25